MCSRPAGHAQTARPRAPNQPHLLSSEPNRSRDRQPVALGQVKVRRYCATSPSCVRGSRPTRSKPACRASGRIAVRWDTSSLWAREVPRPEIDVAEARLELCRRHVHCFGPTSSTVFAWWSGLSPADARVVWDQLAGELGEVDFDGVPGWVLRADEDGLWSAEAVRGVRLLVAPDLRLFGRDRAGRFIAPGLRALTEAAYLPPERAARGRAHRRRVGQEGRPRRGGVGGEAQQVAVRRPVRGGRNPAAAGASALSQVSREVSGRCGTWRGGGRRRPRAGGVRRGRTSPRRGRGGSGRRSERAR